MRGQYCQKNFIHMDTGDLKSWDKYKITEAQTLQELTLKAKATSHTQFQ